MKVEINTINKTIKIVDDCNASEFLKFFLELENYMEYKLIPNTIINTIKIRDIYDPWVKPYTQPWTINPYHPFISPNNPYTVMYNTGVTLTNFKTLKPIL